MAIGATAIGTGTHSAGTSTTVMTFSITIPSGATHVAIQLARGYTDGSTPTFPATIDVAGTTISQNFAMAGGTISNHEGAAYLLDSSDISTIGTGSSKTVTVTFANATDGSTSVQWGATSVAESDQTLIDSDEVDGYLGSSPMSVTVTSASGDLVLVLGCARGSSTLSSATGFTNIAGSTGDSGGTGIQDAGVRTDYIVASGSTTDAEMEFTSAEQQSLAAFVFRQAAAGDVDVSAGVDALTLTEYAATVTVTTAVSVALVEYAEHTASEATASTSSIAAPQRWPLTGV